MLNSQCYVGGTDIAIGFGPQSPNATSSTGCGITSNSQTTGAQGSIWVR